MDELAIYVNVERPAGHSSTREREMQSAEKIYENMFLNTLEPNITGPAFSGNKHMQTYTQAHTDRIDNIFKNILENVMCEEQ